MDFIKIEDVYFRYQTDTKFAIKLERFSVDKCSSIFIEGPSGCGKTTFLNLLTGLIKPNKGEIQLLGSDITQLNPVKCDRFRADHFGIIFQLFNLIPYLNVIENITLPCLFSEIRKNKALLNSKTLDLEATRLCHELDIGSELISTPVNKLSIGQQQRVAIARALIGQPEIIIADEPTSALDSERKEQFMSTLLGECKKYDATLIFVSHDMSLKKAFDKVYNLNNENLAYRDL